MLTLVPSQPVEGATPDHVTLATDLILRATPTWVYSLDALGRPEGEAGELMAEALSAQLAYWLGLGLDASRLRPGAGQTVERRSDRTEKIGTATMQVSEESSVNTVEQMAAALAYLSPLAAATLRRYRGPRRWGVLN